MIWMDYFVKIIYMSKHRTRNKGGGKRNRTQYDKVLRKRIQTFPHPEEKSKIEKTITNDEEREMDEIITEMEEKIYGQYVQKSFTGLPLAIIEDNHRWPID